MIIFPYHSLFVPSFNKTPNTIIQDTKYLLKKLKRCSFYGRLLADKKNRRISLIKNLFLREKISLTFRKTSWRFNQKLPDIQKYQLFMLWEEYFKRSSILIG